MPSFVYCEDEDEDDDYTRDESSTNMMYNKYGVNEDDLHVIPWLLEGKEKSESGKGVNIYYQVKRLIKCGEYISMQVEFGPSAVFHPQTGFLKDVLDREESKKYITVFTLPTADSGCLSGKSEDYDPPGYTSYMKRHNIGNEVKKCFITSLNIHTGLTEPFKLKTPHFTKDGCRVENSYFDPNQNLQRNKTLMMRDSLIRAVENHMQFAREHAKAHAVIGNEMHLGAYAGKLTDTALSSIQILKIKEIVTRPSRRFFNNSRVYLPLKCEIRVGNITDFAGARFLDQASVGDEMRIAYNSLGVAIDAKTQAINIKDFKKEIDGNYQMLNATVFIKPGLQDANSYSIWVYQFKDMRKTSIKHWILTDDNMRLLFMKTPADSFDESKMNILLISGPFASTNKALLYGIFESEMWFEQVKESKDIEIEGKLSNIPKKSGYKWVPSKVKFNAAVDSDNGQNNPQTPAQRAVVGYVMSSDLTSIQRSLISFIKGKKWNVFQSDELNRRLQVIIEQVTAETTGWSNPRLFDYKFDENVLIISDEVEERIPEEIMDTHSSNPYSIFDEFVDDKLYYQGGCCAKQTTKVESYLWSIWVSICELSTRNDLFGSTNQEYNLTQKSYVKWFVYTFRTFTLLKDYVHDWFDSEANIRLLKPVHIKYAKEVQGLIRRTFGDDFQLTHKFVIATALNLEIFEHVINNFSLSADCIGFSVSESITCKSLLIWGMIKDFAANLRPNDKFGDFFDLKVLSWSGSGENFERNLAKAKSPKTNPYINSMVFEIGYFEYKSLWRLMSEYPNLKFLAEMEHIWDLENVLYQLSEKKTDWGGLAPGQILVDWKSERKMKLIESIISFHTPSILAILYKQMGDQNTSVDEYFKDLSIQSKWSLFKKHRNDLSGISPGEFQATADKSGVRITVLNHTYLDMFTLPTFDVAHGHFCEEGGGSDFIMWCFSPVVSEVEAEKIGDLVLLKEGNSYRQLTNDKVTIDVKPSFVRMAYNSSGLGKIREHVTEVGFFESISPDIETSVAYKNFIVGILKESRNLDHVVRIFKIRAPINLVADKNEIAIMKYEKDEVFALETNILISPKWKPTMKQAHAIFSILTYGWYKGDNLLDFVYVFRYSYHTHSSTYYNALDLMLLETIDFHNNIRKKSVWKFGNPGKPRGAFFLFDNGIFKKMELSEDEAFDLIKNINKKYQKKTNESIPNQTDVTELTGNNQEIKNETRAQFIGYGEERVSESKTLPSLSIHILRTDKYSGSKIDSSAWSSSRSAFDKLYVSGTSNENYRPLITISKRPRTGSLNYMCMDNFKVMMLQSENTNGDKKSALCKQFIFDKELKARDVQLYFDPQKYDMGEIKVVDEQLLPLNFSIIDCVRQWFDYFSPRNLRHSYLTTRQSKIITQFSADPTLTRIRGYVKGASSADALSIMVNFTGMLCPENINLKAICITIDHYCDVENRTRGQKITISPKINEIMEKVKLRWPVLCGKGDWNSIKKDDTLDYRRGNVTSKDALEDMILLGAIFNARFSSIVPAYVQCDINSVVEDPHSIPYIPMWTDYKFRWPDVDRWVFDYFSFGETELSPFRIPVLVKLPHIYPVILKSGEQDRYELEYHDGRAKEKNEKIEKVKDDEIEDEIEEVEKVPVDGKGVPMMPIILPAGPKAGGGDKGKGGGGADYSGQYSDGLGGSSGNGCPHFEAWVAAGNDPDLYPGSSRRGRRGRNLNPDDEEDQDQDSDRRDRGRGRGYGNGRGGGGHAGKGTHGVRQADGSTLIVGNTSRATRENEQNQKEKDEYYADNQRETTGFGSEFHIGIDAVDNFAVKDKVLSPLCDADCERLNLSGQSDVQTYAQEKTKEIYMLTCAMGTAMMTIDKLIENGWTTIKIHVGQTEEARKIAILLMPFFRRCTVFPISKSYTSHLLFVGDGYKAREARQHNLLDILESCAGLNTRTLNRACGHVRDMEIISKEEFDQKAEFIDKTSQKLFRDWFVQGVNISKAYIQSTFQGRVEASKGYLTPAVASILNKRVFCRLSEATREKNKEALIYLTHTEYGKQLRPLFDVLFVDPQPGIGSKLYLCDQYDENDDTTRDEHSFY